MTERPYQYLRDIIEQHQPGGWAIEFGVHSGRSLSMIAEYMPVIGLDSFEGLPEDWREGYMRGEFAYAPGQPLPYPDHGIALLIKGWFDDTVPVLKSAGLPPLGLVHIDCDLYSSTVVALDGIIDAINPGTIISFDEYHGYEGYEQHEKKAWVEFIAKHGIWADPIAMNDQQCTFLIESIGNR